MSLRLKPGSAGVPRVVVVGAGVAGLEALIALRTLLGNRIVLELISPERSFAYRPLSVSAVFGAQRTTGVEIAEIARAVGAVLTVDSVIAVDQLNNSVTLAGGATTHYDLLLAAPGAVAQDTIPGAIAFGTPGGIGRFRRVLAEAERGTLSRIVFALHSEGVWPLALYELALLTAERLNAEGADAEITLLTPEPAPLAAFGGRASGAVLEELEERGIHFIAGVHPEELAWGELRARPGRIRIAADVVITLPKLCGRPITGLPADDQGFLPVDAYGLVRGTIDVYGAGDAIACRVKHGSLAAQQADVAAASIAARLGAAIEPRPFRPVLRGMLLTGRQTRYLEAEVTDGQSQHGETSTRALWWPPAKLAARHLAPYLSGQVNGPPTVPYGLPVEIVVDGPPPRTPAVTGR